MRRILSIILSAAFLMLASQQLCAQEPQEPDIDEIINNQVENLAKLYKLDDVQIFYIDSILQYNMHGMMDEIEQTRKTGASSAATFEVISDKWLSATDQAFERVFTEDQWKKYMKSAFGKEKKKRDKRISDREAALKISE